MKKYKDIIKAGLDKRHFEVASIFDIDSELSWWIEERWIIKRSFDQFELNVVFLTDRHWESGIKNVVEVILSEKLITNYTDTSSKISGLNLVKGNFDEKMIDFWKEFDVYLNTRLAQG